MTMRRVSALLAVLELAIAVYLEIERARGGSVACPIGGGGCETVQHSSYSKLLGVPLRKGGVLRPLTDDRILHARIAEVIDDRGDGKHAAKSFVQALLVHLVPPPLLIRGPGKTVPPSKAPLVARLAKHLQVRTRAANGFSSRRR